MDSECVCDKASLVIDSSLNLLFVLKVLDI